MKVENWRNEKTKCNNKRTKKVKKNIENSEVKQIIDWKLKNKTTTNNKKEKNENKKDI